MSEGDSGAFGQGKEPRWEEGGACLTERGEKVKVFVSLFNSIVIKPRGLVWGNHFF